MFHRLVDYYQIICSNNVTLYQENVTVIYIILLSVYYSERFPIRIYNQKLQQLRKIIAKPFYQLDLKFNFLNAVTFLLSLSH